MTVATIRAMKQTDESRGDEGKIEAVDSELFLDLDAGSAYWLEVGILMWSDIYYGARIYNRLKFDGILYDPGVHLLSLQMPCSPNNAYHTRDGTRQFITSQSELEADTYNFNDYASSVNIRAMMWITGRITTYTAGRLALWWRHYDSGAASPSKVAAGSFIYATPLDICPI